MELLFACLFAIIILFALFVEYKKGILYSSPLFFMIVSNFSILLLYYLTEDVLGFHPLVLETFLYIICGCGIFAIASLIFSLLDVSKKNNKKENVQFFYDQSNKILGILVVLTSIFMFVHAYTIGISDIANNDDKASSYGGSSLGGHILVFQIMLMAHYIGKKIALKNLFFIVMLFLCIFLYNVKAWFIIPFLVGAMIHFFIKKVKIKLSTLILIACSVFVLFTMSYMLSLGWDLDRMGFIYNHFCKYLFAGFGGMNEAIQMQYPTDINPYHFLPHPIHKIFEYTSSIPDCYDYIVINDATKEWTNVLSLIGSFLLIHGPMWGTICIFVLACISYLLFYLRLNTNNYWYMFSYYFWASGLLLSFFGNYYLLMNIWELTLWPLVIGTILKFNTKYSNFKTQKVC